MSLRRTAPLFSKGTSARRNTSAVNASGRITGFNISLAVLPQSTDGRSRQPVSLPPPSRPPRPRCTSVGSRLVSCSTSVRRFKSELHLNSVPIFLGEGCSHHPRSGAHARAFSCSSHLCARTRCVRGYERRNERGRARAVADRDTALTSDSA